MITCSVCKRMGCSIIESYKGTDDPHIYGWCQGDEDSEVSWICPRHAKDFCNETADKSSSARN